MEWCCQCYEVSDMRQTMTLTGGSKGQGGAGFWKRPLSNMPSGKGNWISSPATVKLQPATDTVAKNDQAIRVGSRGGAPLLHFGPLLKSVAVSTNNYQKTDIGELCRASICVIRVRKVQNVELVLVSQLSWDLYGSFVQYVSCGPALRV